MIHRLLYSLLIVASVSSIAWAGVIRNGSLTASSNGEEVIVRWISENEDRVSRYELERKAEQGGQFSLLAEILPRGNNRSYEYIDDTAFRFSESIYQYRLKVVFDDGSTEFHGPISVRVDISSVRKTWGSIKAMFR